MKIKKVTLIFDVFHNGSATGLRQTILKDYPVTCESIQFIDALTATLGVFIDPVLPEGYYFTWDVKG
jgi:hypothetical protein